MQVQKIRQLLRERSLAAVNVGTVDDFQGQEARIVFISAVLTRLESLPQALHHDNSGDPWPVRLSVVAVSGGQLCMHNCSAHKAQVHYGLCCSSQSI